MADDRHLEKSKNVVSMDIINSLFETGNPSKRRHSLVAEN